MSERRLGIVVAIIQARMGSRRLPGKVLQDIAGQPMLAHVVRRTSLAASVDRVVVGTSTDPSDDLIAGFCEAANIAIFRGHPTDLLDRYYRAAKAHDAETVVRITGDCPLMDPEIIERTLQAFAQSGADLEFAASRLPYDRTYPIGLDVEVCSLEALQIAWTEADQPHQREHVMPYFYENPDRFRFELIHAERDLGDLRWTVDTAEDLEFVRAVYSHFAPRLDFGWREVLRLVEAQPELAAINSGVPHRSHKDVG